MKMPPGQGWMQGDAAVRPAEGAADPLVVNQEKNQCP